MSDLVDHHLGEDLGALADGGTTLTPARRAYLNDHVADCASCRNALAAAELILSSIDSASPPEPSKGFDRALFAKLDAIDRRGRPSLLGRARGLVTPVHLAAIAAASIALMALLLWVAVRSHDADEGKPAGSQGTIAPGPEGAQGPRVPR